MTMPSRKRDSLTNDQELELLARVIDRDRDALAHLYLLYHRKLFKFVFQLTRSFSASDELVNDVMMLVWQKAATFRGDSKLSTWIFGIAYRQAMRRVTKQQMKRDDPIEPDDLAEYPDVSAENEDWILRGLHQLPAAQQLATVLVFYLGLTYEETARVADCPVNTVKTRMFHAKRKLREYLEASARPITASSERNHDQ